MKWVGLVLMVAGAALVGLGYFISPTDIPAYYQGASPDPVQISTKIICSIVGGAAVVSGAVFTAAAAIVGALKTR